MNHTSAHFDYINLPRRICTAVLGKNHQAHHRIAVGSVIMLGGVLIAHGSHLFEVWLFKIGCDFVGYSFHGIGSVPLIEWLMDEDHSDPNPPTPPSAPTAAYFLSG